MALVLVGPVSSFAVAGPPVDISDKFPSAAKRMLTRFADANGSPQLSAVSSICTHRQCPILTGSAEWNTTPQPIYDPATKVITCPCDLSMFNVQTGAVVHEPAKFPLTRFPVQIRGTDVYVDSDPAPQDADVA
jgi:nitrite reductase/ring-hydroxylating ferredoxin subunit